MRARAYAKVNLGLRVRARGVDGLHPVRGLSQTVDWYDEVAVEDAVEDVVEVPEGGAPADETNLAWRAVAAARSMAGDERPIRVVVTKQIPSPAGLGGGSADAAAALGLAGRRFSVSPDDVRTIAETLGSDVPFALVGGTAIVSGAGEFVSPQPELTGFALAIVVPPITLVTAAVYREWDALGGPEGPVVGSADLPPTLRDHAPLANDLYPAAVSLAPSIDEWRAELAHRWGVPASMTGSGAALFAYFQTHAEAEDAVAVVPDDAVVSRAVGPVPVGWKLVDESTG